MPRSGETRFLSGADAVTLAGMFQLMAQSIVRGAYLAPPSVARHGGRTTEPRFGFGDDAAPVIDLVADLDTERCVERCIERCIECDAPSVDVRDLEGASLAPVPS